MCMCRLRTVLFTATQMAAHLNERLTLIANLSVVAGIVFLGLELNQNTGVMKAQAQANLTANRISFAVRMMDPVNADLVVKARGEDTLTASERLRYNGTRSIPHLIVIHWNSQKISKSGS